MTALKTTPLYNFSLTNFDAKLWHRAMHNNFKLVDALFGTLGVSSVAGVWANSTAYITGTRVLDPDISTVFECLADHTSAASGTFAADRIANPTYWRTTLNNVTWRGAWTTGVVYFANDFVFVGDIYYRCLIQHTSGATFAGDIANWEVSIDLTTSVAACAASAAAALASEVAALASENAAAATYDTFHDRYLTPKAADPTLDDDGDALVTGTLYYNTTLGLMRVYTGTIWQNLDSATVGALLATNNLSDVADVPTARNNLSLGTMAIQNAASVAITGGTWTTGGSINGISLDNITLGATTPGNIYASQVVVKDTYSPIDWWDTDYTTTHNRTRYVRTGSAFQQLTLDDSAAFVATDFTATIGASGASNWAWYINGALHMTLSSTKLELAVPFRTALGSVGAPGYTFTGDTDTGVYSPAADQWAVAIGGTQKLLLTSSGATLADNLTTNGISIATLDTDLTTAEADIVALETDVATKAFEFIQTVDVSSPVATLDFVLDTTKYDAFEFEIGNLVPATDSVSFWARYSDDGGSSFLTTSYETSGARLGAFGGTGTTALDLTAGGSAGSAANEDGMSGSVTIHFSHLSGVRTITTYELGFVNANGSFSMAFGAGHRNVAAAHDAIRFMFSSGNIESGSITMYGKRNS